MPLTDIVSTHHSPASARLLHHGCHHFHVADPHQDMILADGISRLCDDLGVEPSDIVMVRRTFAAAMLTHLYQLTAALVYIHQLQDGCGPRGLAAA